MVIVKMRLLTKCVGIYPTRLGVRRVHARDAGLETHFRRPKKSFINSDSSLNLFGQTYKNDSWTNITPKILQLVERKIHLADANPICILKRRIVNVLQQRYRKSLSTSPLFTLVDSLSPVVSFRQNFDSLLVPVDHVSRAQSDSYYINRDYMLRAHTSAHQADTVSSGLDAFLVCGDVYRRDTVDRTHYPAFHQMEGVRLFTAEELFAGKEGVPVFEPDPSAAQRTAQKQEGISRDASIVLEQSLKACLELLAESLFGSSLEWRWVETYFPFTHPSWELEMLSEDGTWMEILGCGIMEQEILRKHGAGHKVGWAFGIGLERLAMMLYKIPDIRLFWSTDPKFLGQFDSAHPEKTIVCDQLSIYSRILNDISFFLPSQVPQGAQNFTKNDFYDMVRSIGGDTVEEVTDVDEFLHPKRRLLSNTYRIAYSHMERHLTQDEVNIIHQEIEAATVTRFGVEMR